MIKGVAGYIPLRTITPRGRPGQFELLLGLLLAIGGLAGLLLPSPREPMEGFKQTQISPLYDEPGTLDLTSIGDIVSVSCIVAGAVFILLALKKFLTAYRFGSIAASTRGEGDRAQRRALDAPGARPNRSGAAA